MGVEIMRVSAKGQLTIPISIRKKMNIREGDYFHILADNGQIRLMKVEPIKPLSDEDPVWKMVGKAESGYKDVSVNHNQYVAEGEFEKWEK